MAPPLKFGGGGLRTIDEARAWAARELFVNRAVIECPCCTQTARLDDRNFDEFKAFALVLFATHLRVGEWMLTHELAKAIDPALEKDYNGREWPRLKLWGLLEDRGENGAIYRLTAKGRAAVVDAFKVPQKVWSFKGIPRSESSETTTVIEVLGREQFDELRRKGPVSQEEFDRLCAGGSAVEQVPQVPSRRKQSKSRRSEQ